MAVIGDVLVKLVADFAEFSKGMQESSKQLDDFAKRGAAASESIAGAFELLKKGVAALGIAEVFHRISEEADKELSMRITREYKIATIPVSAFYRAGTDNKVIRFCFCKKKETIDAAVDRLSKIHAN